MKKITKVVLCIVLVLLVAVIGVFCWQWDNIKAIKTSVSYTREDIAGMMEENDQKIVEATEKVDGIIVRDLTEEEKLALRNGELDRDELLDAMTTEETAQPAAESQEESNEKLLSKYLAEIYLMKAEYTAWLEDKHAEAIAEYNALEESKRTTAAKYNIGMRYMEEALAKEKECDALMADIEQKILDLLKEMGGDTSLVDDIQAAYEQEKELKKAYFLGLHN